MCSGKTNPSGQTISMICNEFGINEDWLRTGEGEVYVKYATRMELDKAFNGILSSKDPFKKKLIGTLARMTEQEWATLKHIVMVVSDYSDDI